MSNNNKVKGLLKGLRFISQIFDTDEKDSEIQISNPTDVRHVGHIGLDGHDGPSENDPSWMNEFKPDDSVQRTSQDSNEFPKSSKRQTKSMGNIRESHAKEKSDRRPRPHKKSSKTNSDQNDSCNGDTDSLQQQQGNDFPPKKSRPKMSKDGSNNVGGDSSKTRSKPHHHHHHHSRNSYSNNNQEGHARHSSKTRTTHGSFEEDAHSRNKHGSFEEEEQFQRRSCENILKSYPN
ncbi:hypothetical protein AAZX31_03G146300 [Glycine max]|uniref:CRIB domain-containing protein n=2 Tax=Glycine subgen. Soja TaxID=1462606 RepID=K7KFH1_SOYBN|nr:CRIB domain-containing protein RIC5 [Glycine max]XP_028223677.1 CRIB domain-containing protein RIC5-like [Glycine soja]KAH1070330.1 hypothetical protein GYH30_007436 [Glycine max]KAH1258430.1 CRIB domain-containing protein RIC5 [Glycine max]KRH67419.1 hypothetical protein GLYMA_03G164900v4 [Glycine max]RZC21005.1 CRIB domain-containing protein RIC5 [Glycine soja]|eukprot:XP_006577703.1 CRIB domain-containing protein RIC5 [Glycine max]